MSGAAVIGSALTAGLLDVLTIHLAPVWFGGGTPLFTSDIPLTALEPFSLIQTPNATHLTASVEAATTINSERPAGFVSWGSHVTQDRRVAVSVQDVCR